jgi:arrestin-related trafficking adapter 3/6
LHSTWKVSGFTFGGSFADLFRSTERIDSYVSSMDMTRTATNVIHLLNLQHKDETMPLLPLSSDDPLAYENSPLATLRPRGVVPSEVVSQFLGPGPWSIRTKLHLPADCTVLHPTSRSGDSTVHVSHMLCITMRLSRGDDSRMDTKTGKRKLFEVVVRLPVHILSVGYPLLFSQP